MQNTRKRGLMVAMIPMPSKTLQTNVMENSNASSQLGLPFLAPIAGGLMQR
jgi:hypothetical protein